MSERVETVAGSPGNRRQPASRYATVLFTMGIVGRLAGLADPGSDTVGLQLEEEHLPKRIRGPRKRKTRSEIQAVVCIKPDTSAAPANPSALPPNTR
jgi:hypothetical protein